MKCGGSIYPTCEPDKVAVSKEPQCVEPSVALTILAYPLRVQLQTQGLPETGAWRRVPRKWNCTWPLPRVQSDQSVG
jgi:hypothetical protein